jgi:DNA ligase 1
MKLETLYKRTKTGEIQFWQVSLQTGDPDQDGSEHPQIVKCAGRLGTDKPTCHCEVIRKGKNIGKANETTPMDQAKSQMRSDWARKRDEGYKSLEDLGIKTFLGEDTVADIHAAVEAKLPRFNTDASGNVKPMLATDWKKVKNISYPVLIQPKLDGLRCLMVFNEHLSDGGFGITFLSRSGKEYHTLKHISDSVASWYAKEMGNLIQSGNKVKPGHFSFILDGEIYSDELTFQEITQAAKKQYPNSLKLHFRAYDIVTDEDQKKRLDRVAEIVKTINSPHISLVETLIAGDEAHVKREHDRYVQEGSEGAMIRFVHGMYAQGQRSRELLKVKEFDEGEFRFLNWDTGQREEDLLAVCFTDSGAKFTAKMMGSREYKAHLRKSMSGDAKMTIKHFGWTSDGLPRFPIGKGFRDDGE